MRNQQAPYDEHKVAYSSFSLNPGKVAMESCKRWLGRVLQKPRIERP